jgi:4a-hydroxytetrahydrobiopterin dehydratase
MSLNTSQSLLKILLLIMASSFCLLPQSLKADTMSLTPTEIKEKIAAIPEWKQKDQTLTRTFEFKNFVEAIAFVDQLVEPAEAAKHHPDIAISYNKVTLSLTSHEAGGITQADFDLAQTISELASN